MVLCALLACVTGVCTDGLAFFGCAFFYELFDLIKIIWNFLIQYEVLLFVYIQNYLIGLYRILVKKIWLNV